MGDGYPDRRRHPHHAHYDSGAVTTLRYMPWVDRAERATFAADISAIQPTGGRVVSVKIFSESATMDSTVVGIHLNENATASQTDTINIADADTVYTANFTQEFAADDLLAISINPTGATDEVQIVVWLELDED